MSKQFQFHINREEAGQRLDVFLASRLGQFSRMRIANLLAADACLVNQQIQKAGYHIAVDDWVEMTLDDSVSTSMSAENIPLEVLYEDEQILIVIKPAGMLVHPNKNTKSGTLANALSYHLNRWRMADGGWRIEPAMPQSAAIARHSADENHQQAERPGIDESAENPPSAIRHPQSQTVVRPGLVHRLDRATSGLMVVAKTQKALSILTKHFHKRLVKKLYLAVVEGCLQEDTGDIIAPIGHDESKKPPRWVMADGKHAETRFRVLERRNGATLVELEPVTGRTNQLRIHCAYIGHPIIGDTVYGSESGVESPASGVRSPISGMKAKDHEQPLTDQPSAAHQAPQTPDAGTLTIRLPVWTPDFPRLCLHAARLEFHHPLGGRWMEFQATLPPEIEGIWEAFASA